MKDLVKAVKIPKFEGDTRSTVWLEREDNLNIGGRREIVDYLECHRGLHAITTIRTDGALRYLKQTYLATAEMLRHGELVRFGKPDYDTLEIDREFYQRSLVRQRTRRTA